MERINIKEITGDQAPSFMFRKVHLKNEFCYYNFYAFEFGNFTPLVLRYGSN